MEQLNFHEWTEQCLTCNKAGGIPRWGWRWACNEVVCEYESLLTVEEIEALTTTTKKDQFGGD